MFDYEMEDTFNDKMFTESSTEDTIMTDEELQDLMDNIEDYE